MKRLPIYICVLLSLFLTGCSDKQAEPIARQAGLFAAVGWIAYDSPDIGTKQYVSDAVEIVKIAGQDIEDGMTYTEALYPMVSSWIEENVSGDEKALALAGTVSILSGLDIMFASHPEWREDEVLALQCFLAFADGASMGLAMAEDDPIMRSAIKSYDMRRELKSLNP